MSLISSSRLTETAVKFGIASRFVMCKDELYVALSPRDVTVTLSNTLQGVLAALEIKFDDTFECNHVSAVAVGLCMLTTKRSGGEAPAAFGVFDYLRDAGGFHELNVAAHWNGSDLYLAFYEPQKELRQVKLSKKEIASCIGLHFY